MGGEIIQQRTGIIHLQKQLIMKETDSCTSDEDDEEVQQVVLRISLVI